MPKDRDYSLLRPFDLEAARRGELICIIHAAQLYVRKYIAGPDRRGNICVQDPSDSELLLHKAENYSMSPLCWVEGKPVYKGDTLYGTGDCKDLIYIIDTFDGYCLQSQPGTSGRRETPDNLTWTPPKTKREGWMNCYKSGENYVYPTKERADYSAMESRIACIRIEWEE